MPLKVVAPVTAARCDTVPAALILVIPGGLVVRSRARMSSRAKVQPEPPTASPGDSAMYDSGPEGTEYAGAKLVTVPESLTRLSRPRTAATRSPSLRGPARSRMPRRCSQRSHEAAEL